MEKKPHDAKDPDAVLHFAQELDSASTGDTKTDSRSPEAEQPSTAASQQTSPTATAESEGKEQKDDEHHEANEDDPGLVARMTAKGALWGF